MAIAFLNKSHARIITALDAVIRAERDWSALPADKRQDLPNTIRVRLQRVGFNAPALKRSANAAAPAIREACANAPHASDFANAAHRCACDKVVATLDRGIAILAGFNA